MKISNVKLKRTTIKRMSSRLKEISDNCQRDIGESFIKTVSAATAVLILRIAPRINYLACVVTLGDVLLIGGTSLTILSCVREKTVELYRSREQIRELASLER